MSEKDTDLSLKLLDNSTSFKRFNIKDLNRKIADYFLSKKSYNLFNNF